MLNERNAIGLETSADAFELASLAMTSPDRRFAAAVADGTFAQAWSRAIRQVLGENATEAGAIAGSAFPHKSPDDIFHQLRCSYTNTFLNMPRPKVSPYESAWTSDDKALLYANDTCRTVRECYRAHGMEPEALHEPADHIAYELGFFSLLVKSGEVGGAKRFWQDHLGLWLERLCAAVIARDEPFYAPLFRDLSEVAASVNESLEPKGARS